MILVDIQVPVLDKIFDFELDEEACADAVLEEIQELIAGQEGLDCEEPGKMYLYVPGQEGILTGNETLKQQGIRDGDRLILI
ncbi:EsaB/YukD family protein [Lachnospiraceae bacterium 54-11]|nr:hypothetical protein [Lachnospiraceae bacterium]MCI9326702.1 hypothetical protein [Lachnospiraceae bacterium]